MIRIIASIFLFIFIGSTSIASPAVATKDGNSTVLLLKHASDAERGKVQELAVKISQLNRYSEISDQQTADANVQFAQLSGGMQFPGPGTPASSGATAFSIAFTDHAEDTTTQTTYTWSSKAFAIGTANATRLVGAAISARSAVAPTVSSVTIGGVSATKVVECVVGTPENVTSMWQAAVPTGTTATISATFSLAAVRAGIAVYSVLGSNGVAPSGAAIATSTLGAPSASITVPSGGGSIISSVAVVAGATVTATNFTIDLNSTSLTSNTFYMAGSDTAHSGSTTYTVNWTAGGAPCATFAAWSP